MSNINVIFQHIFLSDLKRLQKPKAIYLKDTVEVFFLSLNDELGITRNKGQKVQQILMRI